LRPLAFEPVGESTKGSDSLQDFFGHQN